MKIDMHIHSNISKDSSNTLLEIEKAAISKEIDGVAICNHNIFYKYDSSKILIIPSAEYSTEMGHILVYFLIDGLENHAKKGKNNLFSAIEIINLAHKQGALAVLAHPFAPEKPRSKEFFEKIDGIEIFNANSENSKVKFPNLKALEICKKYKKAFTGGSDGHFKKEIGKVYCEFKGKTLEEIKEELLMQKNNIVTGQSSAIYRAFNNILLHKKELLKNPKLFLKLFYSFWIDTEKVFKIKKSDIHIYNKENFL